MAKQLMKGCEALGEAAIRAGCRHFFGYPITPQTEVPEYLSRRMPEVDGVYVQAESEVAASNMIFGAAGAGVRVFTSSSSPGVSLMAEGISYIAGAELPVVIINIVRGGPGLGGILPAQSDYFQATKGCAHGDFKILTLCPSSVQEAADLMIDAFDLADKYRCLVMVMGDGMIGQMMEPVEFKKPSTEPLPSKDWATTGCKGRKPNIITSLWLEAEKLEEVNHTLADKYKIMERDEVRYKEYNTEDDHELLVVAYGTMARIVQTAIDSLKEDGINVGLFRPITIYPYPYDALFEASKGDKKILCAEMSMGQMIEDVRLALKATKEVTFFGRCGGVVPSPTEVREHILKLLNK